MPRGEADKGHTVAVLWVHVRLHLENKARNLCFFWQNLTRGSGLDLWFRPVFGDALHQLAHAEGVDGRAEPDRRQRPFVHRFEVQRWQQLTRHLQIFAQLFQQGGGDVLFKFGIVQPFDLDAVGHTVPVGAVHQFQTVAQHVITTDEIAAHADGPACRCHVDREVLLNFVNDFKSVAALAVHLVTEGQDRQIAHPADFKEFLRLAFHTLGPINDHHGGIHRCQRSVGVFGKVRVAGRVDEVEPVVGVSAVEIERHGRGRDRNPPVLLHRHKVRPRAPRFALGAHLASHLNGPAEQQELFSQRGLARVRVADDRKGATARDLGGQGGAVLRRIQHPPHIGCAATGRNLGIAANRP